MPAAGPLVSDYNTYEDEIAIGKLKSYESPGALQISTEMIQAECNILYSEIHKLINSLWNKEELPQQWKEFITIPISKKGDKTDCSNYRRISLLQTTNKILSYILLLILSP